MWRWSGVSKSYYDLLPTCTRTPFGNETSMGSAGLRNSFSLFGNKACWCSSWGWRGICRRRSLLLLWWMLQVPNNITHDSEKLSFTSSVCFLSRYWMFFLQLKHHRLCVVTNIALLVTLNDRHRRPHVL
jgi:hypothetical protein